MFLRSEQYGLIWIWKRTDHIYRKDQKQKKNINDAIVSYHNIPPWGKDTKKRRKKITRKGKETRSLIRVIGLDYQVQMLGRDAGTGKID